MKTLDMMVAAEGTNDWYNTGDMWYNWAHGGFVDSRMISWPGDAFETLNRLFELNWNKAEPPIRMTRKEAKEKYGIVIID